MSLVCDILELLGLLTRDAVALSRFVEHVAQPQKEVAAEKTTGEP